jgi:hypothetical protein
MIGYQYNSGVVNPHLRGFQLEGTLGVLGHINPMVHWWVLVHSGPPRG